MENKRLSNKLNSLFWFILTAFPLWSIIIGCIGAIVLSNRNLVIQHYDYEILSDILMDENWITINFFTDFMNECSIPGLKTTFQHLFQVLGLQHQYGVVQWLEISFAWMLSIQLYHLIYDVLKFIIEWCHNLIEKAYF